MSESQHLSTYVDRPAAEVYAYVVNPANLTSWATGLSGSIEQRDGRWFAESPMGDIEVSFVPENPYFVLDHEVRLSDGTTFNNPMRVIDHGSGCEVEVVILGMHFDRRSAGKPYDFGKRNPCGTLDKNIITGIDEPQNRVEDRVLPANRDAALRY